MTYEQGRWKCRVTGQGFGESEAKKTPFFYLEIVPMQNLDTGESSPDDWPRMIRFYWTDTTVENNVTKLRSIGWTGTEFHELYGGGFSFVGMTIEARNEHTQRADGRVFDDFQIPLPPRDVVRLDSASEEKIARKLDALYGKALGQNKPQLELKKPPAGDEVPVPKDDDEEEIPF